MSFTNRLIHETSPYLLQHAHNPVNWYPWGEEALEKARVENKPILLSIGYAACHWCHVMERESFEDESTAALMNRYFVNIKIDREERPDLDHIYMDAVQAITGSGGWPLNVFLTPETKPFYGGTYFPPVRAHQRMSWKEVLEAMHTAFTEQRSEIEAQAENLTAHLLHSGNFTTGASAAGEQEDLFTPDTLEQLAQQLMANADPEWGGFGQAPKFPQTFIIRYLLRHYHFTGQKAGLQQALLSLDKMVQGGIYDQLGGGFARYSTDKRWLAPHFEKMLYDNALLVVALSEAFQLTGRAQYARVIRQTLDFVERELLSPQGGFYSALDADSEGVEGKFYTWQQAELEALLGADAPLFSRLYGVEVQGNWEGTNILWLPQPLETVAQACGLPTETLLEKMMQWRQVLLNQRSQRVRPQLDDKVLLGWNALMNKAFVKAAAALNEPRYLQRAQQNMDYLLGAFRSADEGGWFHSLKKEQPPIPAFLDDYACLADALIHLQEMTGRQEYLQQAAVITDYVQQHFRDPATPLFFFTHKRQQDVVVRKKEVYDGATPSGNATMALNLLYLSVVLNRPQWREQAEAMTRLLGGVITRYPASFAIWAAAVQWITCGIAEIAVVGPGAAGLAAEVCSRYLPGKVLQSSETPAEEYPLLAGKPLAQDKVLIYLCKNYACRAPLKNVAELVEQLQQ